MQYELELQASLKRKNALTAFLLKIPLHVICWRL